MSQSYYLGVLGPGFLNQVTTLPVKPRMWVSKRSCQGSQQAFCSHSWQCLGIGLTFWVLGFRGLGVRGLGGYGVRGFRGLGV